MKILLCNERFLFRFGVDRVLILLGHGLKQRGHSISVMANRFDLDIVRGFADNIIEAPSKSGNYIDLNENTAEWLASHWDTLFTAEQYPDIAVIGGWPFFSSIPVFQRFGVKVIFSDHGVVPTDGYSGGHLQVLNKLHALRRTHIGQSDGIVAVSRFIAQSQSAIDAQGKTDVQVILNGADHMDLGVWQTHTLANADATEALAVVEKLRSKGQKIILNLGRWEPGCYKNSEAIVQLSELIRTQIDNCAFLVLSRPGELNLPPSTQGTIIPIGFPDDAELQQIMQLADLGVTVSLWEGFNLPLAEMQWLDKPTLAFNVGAHPEVIVHPWFLCNDVAEMATKTIQILNGGMQENTEIKQARESFHASFRWEDAVVRYDESIGRIASAPRRTTLGLLIDVSNASRDPANSGVIRMTRRICRELQRYCDPLFVIWEPQLGAYVFPTPQEYSILSSFNGPQIDAGAPVSTESVRLKLGTSFLDPQVDRSWLLMTETVMETHGREIRRFARQADLQLAAVFHDAIPVLRPDLVKDLAIRDNHASYMRGLAEADLAIAVSGYSAECLHSFWKDQGIDGCPVVANPNPGELFGSPRQLSPKEFVAGPIDILCVSTLEPRKNHYSLIAAAKLFGQRNPQLDWSLTLVGNRYAGGEDIARFVEEACLENPRIRWMGVVDDDTLNRLYHDSTFTVYASTIEGFGMPILESLWHGRPCICADQGVMAELAAEGGCLTTQVDDVEKLAAALDALAKTRELYQCLSLEAVARPIKAWNEYAQSFWKELIKHTAASNRTSASESINMVEQNPPSLTSWENILYPGCLTTNWQMNDCERLGLTAVLHRLKPRCSIEIGTFKGGSLSLISQYSNAVFSIDIDPSIPDKFRQFSNVSFFTGASELVLPMLLGELDRQEIPVDFVLIDGDHSAAGVKRDIEIMLGYVPKKPLIMMMHDGFNPECRRGMLEADWEKSPYLHWVDVDYIPGRVVEHGGGGDGEMWGGLAMAFLSPIKRRGAVTIMASAKRAFQEMHGLHYT